MMMLKGLLFFHFVLLLGLLLAPQVCSKKAHVVLVVVGASEIKLKSVTKQALFGWGNPATDIVNIINNNRTTLKLPTLYDNPGLGCMALQYAQECKGNCTSNNTVNCRPLDDDFTEVFAPDCGVELPTFDTISGVIVGCHLKYLDPSEAFSQALIRDKKTLTTLRNKTHTEVGVGMASSHKHHFFWCILFSSGQTNSSFALEDHGQGIKQKQGCFSGTSAPCNHSKKLKGNLFLSCLLVCFTLCFLVLVHIRHVGIFL